MLTSAKISQSELPLASVLAPQQGQALPQGAKFSELFASMYSADGSIQEMPNVAETKGLLTDIDGNTISGLMAEAGIASKLDASQIASMDIASHYLNNVDKTLEVDNLPGLVDLDMEQTTQGPAVLGLMEQALNYQSDNADLSKVAVPVSSLSTQQQYNSADEIPLATSLNNVQTIDAFSAELAVDDSFDLAAQDVTLDNHMAAVESEEVLAGEYVVDDTSEYTAQPLAETLSGIAPTMEFGSDEISQQIPSLGSEQQTKAQIDNSPNVNIEDELNIEESEIIPPAMMQANNQASASNMATNAAATSSPASNSVVTAINGSTTNQGMTQWASANNEMSQGANAGFGQGSQSSSQGGANQQNFAAQQQMVQFQEQRSQAIEQQMAVKTSEELIKTDSKQNLLGGDVSLGDRRAQLPLVLQSIPQPVKHPQWGQALGQRVVFMANNQLQQAQITLNPEKLGPVSVKLHMDKDQQVHVTMTAQHTTTREAMESALPRLKEMLEQAGVDLGSVDVGDDQKFAENDAQDSETTSAQADGSEVNVGSDETTAPVTVASTDNIVDYYA